MKIIPFLAGTLPGPRLDPGRGRAAPRAPPRPAAPGPGRRLGPGGGARRGRRRHRAGRRRRAGLPADERHLRQPHEHRLGHDEQRDDAVGGGLPRLYPNVKMQIEGKGSSTAPPALIDGTAQFGPMSRPMKADEIDEFEKKFGYKPTALPTSIDMLAVYVHKDNPIEGLTLRPGRRDLLQDPQGRPRQGHPHLGRPGPDRRVGHTPDQPLRAQLRRGHLRLLQGARALQGRLQGRGQGAAGQRVGGAGRRDRPVRASATAASATRPPTCARCRCAEAEAARSSRPRPTTATAASTRCRASCTSTSTTSRASQLDPLRARVRALRAEQQGQEEVVKDGYLPVTAAIVARRGGRSSRRGHRGHDARQP